MHAFLDANFGILSQFERVTAVCIIVVMLGVFEEWQHNAIASAAIAHHMSPKAIISGITASSQALLHMNLKLSQYSPSRTYTVHAD